MLKLTGHEPHIWKFIEIIQNEESEYRTTILSLENGTYVERRNSKDLLRDNKILELKNMYLRKEIDRKAYIEKLVKYMPNCDKVKK